jgi:uncharacterized protein YfaP (DUF2135 family)
MQKIDLNTVLVFDLVTKEQRIAELEANIENWKARQVEQAHSASDIRYYAELVYAARTELAQLKGIEQDKSIACLCCVKGVGA